MNGMMTAGTGRQEQTAVTPGRTWLPVLLPAAAALTVAAGLLVALRFVPAVEDEYPRMSSSLLWASVVTNILVAGFLTIAAFNGRLRAGRPPWGLLVVGTWALIQALLYLDLATGDYTASRLAGERIESDRVWVGVAAAADGIAGLLILTGVAIVEGWAQRILALAQGPRWAMAVLLSIAAVVVLAMALLIAEDLGVATFIMLMFVAGALSAGAILVLMHDARRRTFAWMAATGPALFVVAAVIHNVEYGLTEVEGASFLLIAMIGGSLLILAGLAGMLWTLVRGAHLPWSGHGPAVHPM